jgi:hypothetical protein
LIHQVPCRANISPLFFFFFSPWHTQFKPSLLSFL